MSSNYDKTDAAISLLISRKEIPFTESPLKSKNIQKFYSDINKFSRKVATSEEREKIALKYQEFSEYLTNKETNEFYKEAIIFQNVMNKIDLISNYKGRELLALYCYFNNEYCKVASFKEEGIKLIRKQFNEVVNKEKFTGIYDFRFPLEVKRCLKDALNGKYELNEEELKHIEKIFESSEGELRTAIIRLYKNKYHVGVSNNLPKEELKKEFRRLYVSISDETFEAQIGRKVNLVDMYLMTNIQPEDFNNVTNLGLSFDETKALLLWFKHEFMTKLNSEPQISKFNYVTGVNLDQLIKKMSFPSDKTINSFNNGDFDNYHVNYYSEKDLQKTYEVLLDLNNKYGLKIDPYTYICMLNSVVWGEEDTYYRIANTFKPILDKNTHLVRTDNPAFTRRYKNED